MLYEVWRFIAPGLYAHEKKLVLPLIASSTVLFFIGMAFAYFLVFQTVFGFITAISPEGVNWTPDIAEYFSFAITLFIAFGVAFEIPVVVYLLVQRRRDGGGNLKKSASLHNCRRFCSRRHFYAARCHLTTDAGHPLLVAI